MVDIHRDVVFLIISYLPYNIQSKLCIESYQNVVPYAIGIITRSMKYNKRRILHQVFSEEASVSIYKSAFVLYRFSIFSRIVEMDIYQGFVEDIAMLKLKCSSDIVKVARIGLKLNWPIKKIYKQVIMKSTEQDLINIGW